MDIFFNWITGSLLWDSWTRPPSIYAKQICTS